MTRTSNRVNGFKYEATSSTVIGDEIRDMTKRRKVDVMALLPTQRLRTDNVKSVRLGKVNCGNSGVPSWQR